MLPKIQVNANRPKAFSLYRFLAFRIILLIELLSVLTCFYHCTSHSPNLVGNGSFDIRDGCPNRISQLRLARGWTSSGSPDLFCACSHTKSPVYTGLSFAGSMQPNSGDCYAGFIVNNRYKEYLTFELPKKMRKNTTYCIRFLYSRSKFSGLKVEKLGVYLHKELPRNSQRGQPLRMKTADADISDHPGIWTPVSFTFKCKGGERYISIGSFDNDLVKAQCLPAAANQKINRVFNYSSSGYYFIEDIELIQLRRGQMCTPVTVPADTNFELLPAIQEHVEIDTVRAMSPFTLQDLHFETNRSEILPASYDELNELADYLDMQPELNLIITGHTDNTGTGKNNLALSKARAEAVAGYLVLRGIMRARLSWEGLGDNKPVADNETEEGRNKNRRVEFQLH